MQKIIVENLVKNLSSQEKWSFLEGKKRVNWEYFFCQIINLLWLKVLVFCGNCAEHHFGLFIALDFTPGILFSPLFQAQKNHKILRNWERKLHSAKVFEYFFFTFFKQSWYLFAKNKSLLQKNEVNAYDFYKDLLQNFCT